MNKRIEDLMLFKKILIKQEGLSLLTKNKNNNLYGVASFWTNGQKMITVYEGSSDGSDDKNLSYVDFLNNYDYKIGIEGSDYNE